MSISLCLTELERRMIDSWNWGNKGSLYLKHNYQIPQYAIFEQNSKPFSDENSIYDWSLEIYDESLEREKPRDNMLIHFKGRIIQSILESIIDNSNKNLLEMIIKRANNRLQRRTEH
jgi:hypothetical protein